MSVAVHEHNDVAAGVRQASRQGRRLPKVALQSDDVESVGTAMQPWQHGKGAVRAAVVDRDDFVGCRRRRERSANFADQWLNILFFIKNRNDDRQLQGLRMKIRQLNKATIALLDLGDR